MQVTQDDLLDALRSALGKHSDGEGSTAVEMAATLGVTAAMVRKALHIFKAEGRLVAVSVLRLDLSGRQQRLPGYRIKPKPKRSAR